MYVYGCSRLNKLGYDIEYSEAKRCMEKEEQTKIEREREREKTKVHMIDKELSFMERDDSFDVEKKEDISFAHKLLNGFVNFLFTPDGPTGSSGVFTPL